VNEHKQDREEEIYTYPINGLRTPDFEVFCDSVYQREYEKPIPEIEKVEWDMPPQAETRSGAEVYDVELLQCDSKRDDRQRRKENTRKISFEIVPLYEGGKIMSGSHVPGIVF
jgi:hypothetical protein